MSLVSLLLTLAIVGFCVWLVLLIPMAEVFRKVIIGVVILFMILWLLQGFGITGPIINLRLRN